MQAVEKLSLIEKGIGTPLKRFKAEARDHTIYFLTYEQAEVNTGKTDSPIMDKEDWDKSFGATGLVVTIEVKEMARQNIVQVETEQDGKKTSSKTYRFGVNTVIESDFI